MTPQAKVKFESGPLPKIEGSGRRSTGLWPGHATEAKYLVREATRHPEDWTKIATGLKTHAASRIANLINKGKAEDFKPSVKGHFEARTRRNKDDPEVYDLWARYVPKT